MAVEFWPYWVAFAVSLVCGGALTLLSYGKREPIRQWRWAFMALLYLASAIGYGFMAFGQSYITRDDSISILFGRWWLYAATHGFVAAIVAIGFTQFFINTLVSWVLATVSALSVVGLAYSPTNGGTDAAGVMHFWFAVAIASALAMGVYLLVVAFDLQRFFFFPSEPNEKEGRAIMQNRFWHAVAVVVLTLGLCLYAVYAYIGPEGWDTYKGSADKREETQIWITLLAGDLLVKVLFVPLVYIFLDPSGDINVLTPFELVPTGQQIGDEQQQEPTYDTNYYSTPKRQQVYSGGAVSHTGAQHTGTNLFLYSDTSVSTANVAL